MEKVTKELIEFEKSLLEKFKALPERPDKKRLVKFQQEKIKKLQKQDKAKKDDVSE